MAGLARIYFHLGQAYGISESAAYRNIQWGEHTLAKSKFFRLPGRKAVAASDRAFDIVLIAATETPIERPKKQRRSSAGKNKRHTLKTQLVGTLPHHRRPLPKPPPQMRPALLPHRCNRQHGARSRMTVNLTFWLILTVTQKMHAQ